MLKQWSNRVLVGVFIGGLFLMPLVLLLAPKESFSELENRVLQSTPKLTWKNVISKKFANDAEEFVTDHFPFRKAWVSVKSRVEQLRLQQENNGIYKGKDGYLFEKFLEPDEKMVERYIEAIGEFATKHLDTSMTFLLAPTSIGIYPERLPWLAPMYPQEEVHKSIAQALKEKLTFMDGFDILRPHAKDQEPIYYRTDHHWTTYGAYLAYVAYAESMGWKPKQEQDFTVQTVSDTFLGSFHTKSQYSGLTPDSIQIYTPRTRIETEMTIVDTGKTIANLYDETFLNKKDKYSYFLGGVHALMTIKSELDEKTADLEKLLIIKDSYAHNVVPFLTGHVKEIHVIDIRYYNGKIDDYLIDNDIINVLLLFNTETFVNERSILKLG